MRAKATLLLSALTAVLVFGGCSLLLRESNDDGVYGRFVTIETTAYCSCGQCCHWKYDSAGKPVHSQGRQKGKPKAVGMTASGKMAHPGTIAADTRYYPLGTLMYVPGYGYGVVEDRGGDIKGRRRIDLYFETHQQALRWGRQKLDVVVFPKGSPAMRKDAPPPIVN